MKGFGIEIKNNLLDPKHRKKMGTAVWEFMWCIDKITKIDDEQIGWVLGGKPINLKDIKEEIGITEPKISKNLTKLKNEGYLLIKRTPYGLIIRVNKAYKRFNLNSNKKLKLGRKCEWCGNNKVPLINHHYPISKSDGGKKVITICAICHTIYHLTGKPPTDKIYRKYGDLTKRENLYDDLKGKSHVQKGKSNKTITIDNNNNMQNNKFCFQEELKKYLNDPKEHIRIIGIFMREMNLQPENYQQLDNIRQRNLRPAKTLIGYLERDIIDTIAEIKNLDYITKITLTTVGKFIDGVVANKKNNKRVKKWQEVIKDGKILMKPIYEEL